MHREERVGHTCSFLRPKKHDRELAVSYAKDRGFDVRTDIRPPFSIHRTRRSRSRPVPGFEETPPLLKPGNIVQRALEVGWQHGKRSEGLFWLACVYVESNKSVESYVMDVLAHPKGAGEKAYERKPKSREKYLRATYVNASNKTSVSGYHLSRWVDMVRKEAPHIWKNHAAVIMGVFLKANECGKVNLHLSVRDLGLSAGCGKDKSATALRALVEANLLLRSGPEAKGSENVLTYELRIPESRHSCTTPPSLLDLGVSEIREALCALAGKPALLQLWFECAVRPQKLTSLMSVLSRSMKSVRKTMSELKEFNLVSEADGIVASVKDIDKLKRVTERRGVKLRLTKRAANYELERESWRRSVSIRKVLRTSAQTSHTHLM